MKHLTDLLINDFSNGRILPHYCFDYSAFENTTIILDQDGITSITRITINLEDNDDVIKINPRKEPISEKDIEEMFIAALPHISNLDLEAKDLLTVGFVEIQGQKIYYADPEFLGVIFNADPKTCVGEVVGYGAAINTIGLSLKAPNK